MEACFMYSYVINPGECSMCTWKECIFWWGFFFFFWIQCPDITIKSSYSVVLFRISIALLIFCLKDLTFDVTRVLKSPIIYNMQYTIIVYSSISPFVSVSICFMCLGVLILGVYMLECNTFLFWSFHHFVISLIIFMAFVLECVLSDMNIATLSYLSFPFTWNIVFHPLNLNPCVLRPKG